MAAGQLSGEVAPRDGSYIGYFSSVAWLTPSAGRTAVGFDPTTSSPTSPNVDHYMRTDVKPGIRNVDQLPNAQDL